MFHHVTLIVILADTDDEFGVRPNPPPNPPKDCPLRPHPSQPIPSRPSPFQREVKRKDVDTGSLSSSPHEEKRSSRFNRKKRSSSSPTERGSANLGEFSPEGERGVANSGPALHTPPAPQKQMEQPVQSEPLARDTSPSLPRSNGLPPPPRPPPQPELKTEVGGTSSDDTPSPTNSQGVYGGGVSQILIV